MIKKLALALSVTTICSTIHPAHAFPNNSSLEAEKSRITIKRSIAKLFTRKESLDKRRTAVLSNRKARAEKLAEKRKAHRLEKIARAEKIAEQRTTHKLEKISGEEKRAEVKNIQKNKRKVLKNTLTQAKPTFELRSIRIAKKKSARFENLLVRENFKEAMRSFVKSELTGILSQVKNEFTPLVAMLKGLQPVEAKTAGSQPIANPQPFMAIHNVETRTVAMDEPQQSMDLPPVRSVNLLEEGARENLFRPALAQGAPSVVEEDRKDASVVPAVLETVNETIEHVKNTFKTIKEESYDQLFSYVGGGHKVSRNLEDQEDKVKELVKVSEKAKEDLEGHIVNDTTLHPDALRASKEELTDLLADLKVVESTIETQKSTDAPEKVQGITPLGHDTPTPKDAEEGHTPLDHGLELSNRETPFENDASTGISFPEDSWKSWDFSDESETLSEQKDVKKNFRELLGDSQGAQNRSKPEPRGIRVMGKLMAPPANLEEQPCYDCAGNVKTDLKNQLSSSLLEAKVPVDLVPTLDQLISLGDSLRLPEGEQAHKNATGNISQLRVLIEGKEKIGAVGDIKNEMSLLRSSIEEHPAAAQNEKNVISITAGVGYVKAWLNRLLDFNTPNETQ